MEAQHIIIGGSDAGISAALRIKEINPQDAVKMFLADDYPNFSICGIPFYFSREVKEWRSLAHRTVEDIRNQGIEVLTSQPISAIDPAKKQVSTDGQVHSYDKLLIGTGALSVKPPIEGMDARGVFTLRWIGEMLAIDQYITDHDVKQVVIVGGGYIGIEMADSLTLRGLEVDLVEFFPTILQTVDEPFGLLAQKELERHGVRVHTGAKVEKISPSKNGLDVTGTNFFKNCQLVLVVTGAYPNSSLASQAGVHVNDRGAIKTNLQMETNLPDIFAAGDCVETFHSLLKQNVYLPLGTTAHKQGRIAGENMAGKPIDFKGVLGSQVVKIFDIVAGRTGLHDRDARKHGLPHRSVSSEHWDHKVYYPGAEQMTIRITGNPENGQLLGAQIIGSKRSEVAKRIDIFAAAIHNGSTVEELNDLDLSYTPPLSSPWDPVQMAAQAWVKSI